MGGGAQLEVFTTRPDTLCGATYMVVAPEHPLLPRLTEPQHARALSQWMPTWQAAASKVRPGAHRAAEEQDRASSQVPPLHASSCRLRAMCALQTRAQERLLFTCMRTAGGSQGALSRAVSSCLLLEAGASKTHLTRAPCPRRRQARSEPGHRRGGPHLGGGLRAGQLRQRSHHGRAGPRRSVTSNLRAAFGLPIRRVVARGGGPANDCWRPAHSQVCEKSHLESRAFITRAACRKNDAVRAAAF